MVGHSGLSQEGGHAPPTWYGERLLMSLTNLQCHWQVIRRHGKDVGVSQFRAASLFVVLSQASSALASLPPPRGPLTHAEINTNHKLQSNEPLAAC